VYAKSETYTKAEANKAIEDALSKATGGESAADVLVALDNYKAFMNAEVFGNEEGSGDSRIDTAEAKLAGIADGAQVNVIEEVVHAEGSSITATKNGKTVTIDDSALREAVRVAKAQADKGVADAANVEAKADANATAIETLNGTVAGHTTSITDHTTRIGALENADIEHKAEYETLSGIVSGHTETIAKKAEQTALDAVSQKASANEAAIQTLNETTVPAINTEIAKKADASALTNYHTKDEIASITGNVTEGKTLVQMIAEAQEAATYDDTAIKALITAEEARAKAAEGANATEIARVNSVLLAAIENEDDTALNSIKELAEWINTHGTQASDMAEAIEANADAIKSINEKAIPDALADAKAYTDVQIKAIPAATAEALGLVKVDGTSIVVNEEGTISVGEVSTDKLVQGKDTLILNGGSATE
jgi:hypothetical protein